MIFAIVGGSLGTLIILALLAEACCFSRISSGRSGTEQANLDAQEQDAGSQIRRAAETTETLAKDVTTADIEAFQDERVSSKEVQCSGTGRIS